MANRDRRGEQLSEDSAALAVTESAMDVSVLTASGATESTAAIDLDHFLRAVERRAFQMAVTATRDQDEALDLVQDAMMRLVRRYGDAPAEQWRPLFFKILHNVIMDWHRRRKVRGRWFGSVSRADERDPVAEAPASGPDILVQLQGEEAIDALQKAISALPPRQQQALLLRAWEGLSVAETARIMGCGEGSVKTHYFRAVNSLRDIVEEYLP